MHGRALREMEEQVKMALQSVETYRRKAEIAERRVTELEQSVAGSASSSADSVAIDTIALALQTARGVIAKNMHHADEKVASMRDFFARGRALVVSGLRGEGRVQVDEVHPSGKMFI